MSVTISVPDDDLVPPEIVSTVFYSATVSDSLALLVAETVGNDQRLTWCNETPHLSGTQGFIPSCDTASASPSRTTITSATDANHGFMSVLRAS